MANDVARMMREAANTVFETIESREFRDTVKMLHGKQRFYLSGVGKSGLNAQRAAATWRSFGIDATFEHCTEMLHGGLGGVKNDGTTALIVLSHSGNTEEAVRVVTHSRCFTVTISGFKDSVLANMGAIRMVYTLENESAFSFGHPIAANYVQSGLLDALGIELTRGTGLSDKMIRSYHPR